MALNELQKNCVKSIPIKHPTRGDETLLSLLGLNSAAGDLVGMYKKTLYEGAELPQKAFVDDLCEIIRYVAVAAHAVDVDLESILREVNERAVKSREAVLANRAEDCKGKEE